MDVTQAKEKAVKYIGISKKTQKEVEIKLKKYNVDNKTIKSVISSLKELGYIDDAAYCKSYIKECINMKKFSIFEIKQKLLNKGISLDLIENGLEVLYNLDYEKDVVQRLLATKLEGYDDIKRKNYLYRRGFKINE